MEFLGVTQAHSQEWLCHWQARYQFVDFVAEVVLGFLELL
jgi:hypothetical protein